MECGILTGCRILIICRIVIECRIVLGCPILIWGRIGMGRRIVMVGGMVSQYVRYVRIRDKPYSLDRFPDRWNVAPERRAFPPNSLRHGNSKFQRRLDKEKNLIHFRKLDMSSNDAVILRKAQTYGPIVKGETMEFVKRPFEYHDLQDGDIVVQTMCLSVDPYMVPSLIHRSNIQRGKIRDPSIKSYTPVCCPQWND